MPLITRPTAPLLPDKQRGERLGVELMALLKAHGYGLMDLSWHSPAGEVPHFTAKIVEFQTTHGGVPTEPSARAD